MCNNRITQFYTQNIHLVGGMAQWLNVGQWPVIWQIVHCRSANSAFHPFGVYRWV